MQVLYQVKSIQVTSVCGFLRVVMRQTVRQVVVRWKLMGAFR